MSEISDIMWQTDSEYLKKYITSLCKTYENNLEFRIKRFYENNELKGFCVIKDDNGIRILSEAHYIGTNKYIALQMWKWMTKGAKVVRAAVFNQNIKMLECLKRLKFNIVSESYMNIILERKMINSSIDKINHLEVIFPHKDIRKNITDIEHRISEMPGAKFGDYLPLKHSFGDGVYVREIFIPKGELLVGKIHKHSHPNFLMSGEVSVLTEEGAKRIKGPLSMISPAGTKRVVYAHEDTVWITVHVTNKTDLKEIEDEIIAKTYNELLPEYVETFLIEENNKFLKEANL